MFKYDDVYEISTHVYCMYRIIKVNGLGLF